MKQYFELGDSKAMQEYLKYKDEGKKVDIYTVLVVEK